jgi:hypothetical protein
MDDDGIILLPISILWETEVTHDIENIRIAHRNVIRHLDR